MIVAIDAASSLYHTSVFLQVLPASSLQHRVVRNSELPQLSSHLAVLYLPFLMPGFRQYHTPDPPSCVVVEVSVAAVVGAPFVDGKPSMPLG